MSVDFPALGRPTSPTSANSFNSSLSDRSSPSVPVSNSVGVRLVDVAKWLLPSTAPAPVGSYKSLSRGDQVCQHLTGLIIEDDGADGKGHYHILSGSSGAIGCATLATDFRFVVFLVPEVEERGHARRRFKYDIAAVAAVATVRSAARHEFFASKTAGAVAAAAGFDMDTDFIDKHRRTVSA